MARELGIFTATPEIYEQILGVKPDKPEQVVALNNALQGVAKQAVNIANVLMQRELKSIRDEMAPYTSVVREQEATRQRELFFKEQPDLVTYEALVKQVFDTTLAQGKQFPTVADARKFVAERTRELLKQVNITPAPAAAPNQQQSSQRTTTPPARTMSPTSMGGRTGAAPQGKPSTMQAVWGN